jgi:hypothetical protein
MVLRGKFEIFYSKLARDEIYERVLRLRETFLISSDFANQFGKLDIFDSKLGTIANLIHLYISRKWACLSLTPFH